jgi:hypothetical protein
LAKVAERADGGDRDNGNDNDVFGHTLAELRLSGTFS